MKAKVNDNKTIREESIKKLIASIVQIETNTLSNLEKTVLIETLVNGKSFLELKDTVNLTTHRQKAILEYGVTKLNNQLQKINEKLKIFEESQKELAELRYWKKLLEANIKKENEIDPELKVLLSLTVQQIKLSTRVKQICNAAGIKTVRDLVRTSPIQLLKLRNCGKNSIAEIEGYFEESGLWWNMDV